MFSFAGISAAIPPCAGQNSSVHYQHLVAVCLMQPDRQLVPPAVIAIQGGKCPIDDRVSTPPPTETTFASSDHANTTLPNLESSVFTGIRVGL